MRRQTGARSQRRRIAGGASEVESLEGRRLLAFGALGPEVMPDAPATGNQWSPAVAMDSGGNFAIAWAAETGGGTGWDIFARLYSASGDARGDVFRVNEVRTGDQTAPRIGMNAAGRLVVTWTSAGQGGTRLGVYARAFDAAGAPAGGEVRADSAASPESMADAVGLASDGSFVVTWSALGQDGSGLGVYGRRFDAAATPAGEEFRVNGVTAHHQSRSRVAVAPGGAFIVAYDSELQDGSGLGVYARRFDAAGTALAEEFPVNVATAGDQGAPSVAIDAAGGFAVAWETAEAGGSIWARRYGADGAALGAPFRADAALAGGSWRTEPSLAMAPDGSFNIAWQAYGVDGSGTGISLRRFSAAGEALGGEVLVNRTTAGDQIDPSAAAADGGRLIVAYAGLRTDIARYSTFYQRFGGDELPPLPGTPGPDRFIVRPSATTPGAVDVWLNADPAGAPTWTIALGAGQGLVIEGGDGDDLLMIDEDLGFSPIFHGGTGEDRIVVSAGTFILPADAALHTASLAISAGGSAIVEVAGSALLAGLSIADAALVRLAPGGLTLDTPSIAFAGDGRLDLADGQLIVRCGEGGTEAAEADLTLALRRGRAGGAWDGPGGLVTSADTAITGLALRAEGDIVRVRYTYDGDADLDGQVTAADYFAIDAGVALQKLGYANGDFDHGGLSPTADDYLLIDAAYVRQGPPLILGGTGVPPVAFAAAVETPEPEAAPSPSDQLLDHDAPAVL